MILGINTLLWTAAFNDSHCSLFPRIKAWGFDGVEIATFAFDGFNGKAFAQRARDAGLDVALCSALTGTTSLISDDPAIRQSAHDFIRQGADMAAEMDTHIFVGPYCAPVGQLVGRRRNADEWKRAVEGLSTLAPHFQQRNVTMALEPLNRFETYFLNTAADGAKLCDEVGHPNIGLLIDSFHANIEEKSLGDALAASGLHTRHLHACENDRGIPGTGHVDWPAFREWVRASGYDAWVTIESFGFSIPEIAAAACIWRDLAPEPESIASEGVHFLRHSVFTKNR